MQSSSPQILNLYKFLVNEDGTIDDSHSGIIYTDGGSKGSLNLQYDHKLKCIGRYENDNIKKVYFTDGYNYVNKYS